MIQYICNLCGKEVAKDRLVSLWKQQAKENSPYTQETTLQSEELNFHSECWDALMLVTKAKITEFAERSTK